MAVTKHYILSTAIALVVVAVRESTALVDPLEFWSFSGPTSDIKGTIVGENDNYVDGKLLFLSRYRYILL
eukprot:m.273293 g.273293  ORF g.273293 m.273293 type:complete len:70 (-) comp16279_c1_seq3:365-574(-)